MSSVVFLLGNLTDGGSETKTVKLANRLSKAGHDIHIVYLGGPHTLRDSIDDGVPVRFLDRRGKFSIRALRELRSYVVANNVDTVICVNHYPLIYGWPACRGGNRKRRCIGAMNTYEFTSLRDRFFMILYAYILRRCELVIFGSKAQQRLWTGKYGIHQDKSAVFYNGVDTEYFVRTRIATDDGRDPLEVSQYYCVIGCVAHLRPEKSQMDLLVAMKKLVARFDKRLFLLLIGEGPEEAALRDYVENNGLSGSVRFCGRASDVRPYLAAMDIFVMPSSTEVFSNAILEAMATGLPIVCTAVGGSVEMVVDGVTGFTYPRHDVDRLVQSLSVLIQDKAKRERFGEQGAARVHEAFSIDAMDEQYVRVISGSNGPIDGDTKACD